MVYNYTFIEFYKDLHLYCEGNQLRSTELHHVNYLMHERHRLQEMQVNTELME